MAILAEKIALHLFSTAEGRPKNYSSKTDGLLKAPRTGQLRFVAVDEDQLRDVPRNGQSPPTRRAAGGRCGAGPLR